MLNATELRSGTFFKDGGGLFQVLSYEHTKMGRGSGRVSVKVKNLKTGERLEKSFISGSKVDEANVEKKKARYLYRDGDSYKFMDPVSFEQYSLSSVVLGESAKFLEDNLEVTLLTSDNEPLSLELPNFLAYTVKETPPGERGNSVSNVYKEAVLENDLAVRVPMFIKIGDKVKVDTRTGQYIERVR